MPREVTARARGSDAPAKAPKEEKPARATRRTAPPAEEGGLDREGLAVALGKLRPALRVGGAIPELGHIWMGTGCVTAYDGGLGIRLAYETGATCGAPGRALLALLGTSALRNVALEQEGPALVVRMGRSRTKLVVLDSERDPWPYPEDHGKAVQFSEEVVEALRAVLIVKPPSPATRLEHHGVAMYAQGADVDFYATDSRTIAQAMLGEQKAKLPKFTLIPRPLAEQIVELCPRGAKFYVADDHLAAVGDGVELCSNVLDTTGLIDIPKLVDNQYGAHPDPVALPTGLEAVLDRAEILAGSDDAAVKIVLRGKKFTVSGKYALGELNEELVLEAAHPDVDITVSAVALRRGLLAVDTFSATENSLAFTGENFLYLVAAK